jgi:hypothetical protein
MARTIGQFRNEVIIDSFSIMSFETYEESLTKPPVNSIQEQNINHVCIMQIIYHR